MDGYGPGLLQLTGSTRPAPMKAPLSLTLAVLATAFPLAAQSVPAFLSVDPEGDFRDLGISRLVDAIDALRDPSSLPPPARPESPDASLCLPGSLLFADRDPLAQQEASWPAISDFQATTEISGLLTRQPASAGATSVTAVACAECPTGATAPASQPVLAGATPVPADQVPEPSAILLVLGAAAWILLRRKY